MVSQIFEGVSAADENESNKVRPQVISNGLALDRATLKEQNIFCSLREENNTYHHLP